MLLASHLGVGLVTTRTINTRTGTESVTTQLSMIRFSILLKRPTLRSRAECSQDGCHRVGDGQGWHTAKEIQLQIIAWVMSKDLQQI